MTTESKEKALPGYKSLAEVQKKQVEQNNTIIKQNKSMIKVLESIDKKKGTQEENESALKRSTFKFAVIQILIGFAALYFGVIDVNAENAVVKTLTTTVKLFLENM